MNAPRDLAAVWAVLHHEEPADAKSPPPFRRTDWAAETRAQAEATGESFASVARRRLHNIILTAPRAADMAQSEWQGIPMPLRELMITMAAPEIGDARRASGQPWGAFTDNQRGSIGAYARWLESSLKGARWLTR